VPNLWERANEETFGEAVKWPVDITRKAGYNFPDENNPIYFTTIRVKIEENNRSDNPKYCLGVPGFCSLNEGTHNIMGLSNMFAAYYDHPDELKALIGRLAEEQRQAFRQLADCGCDGVMGYDDWGLQNRLMIKPATIEEFFMPYYRQNWRLAHDQGMDVWLHSCGYTIDLLPRLVEGSIVDIITYVKTMIATLGNHRGGLISMAISSPDAVHHTLEKIAAMSAAFRKYGVYS